MCSRNESDLGHTFFLITYYKTFDKKLLAVHPKKRREKRKQITRMAIANLFVLNTNARSNKHS